MLQYMKKIRFLLFLLIIPIGIFAQRSVLDREYIPNFFIGLEGGYSLNTYTGQYSTFEGTTECGTFKDGSGSGLLFGLRIEYMFSRRISLIGSILYEDRSGKFNKSSVAAPVFISDDKPPVDAVLEEALEAKLNYLSITPLLKFKLLRLGLDVVVGPSFNLLMSNKATQTENILSPSSLYFLGGSKSRTVIDGEIKSKNSLIIDAKAGLLFEIPVTDLFSIVPEVMATFPLMKVTSEYDWKISTIQFLICFRYGFE